MHLDSVDGFSSTPSFLKYAEPTGSGSGIDVLQATLGGLPNCDDDWTPLAKRMKKEDSDQYSSAVNLSLSNLFSSFDNDGDFSMIPSQGPNYLASNKQHQSWQPCLIGGNNTIPQGNLNLGVIVPTTQELAMPPPENKDFMTRSNEHLQPQTSEICLTFKSETETVDHVKEESNGLMMEMMTVNDNRDFLKDPQLGKNLTLATQTPDTEQFTDLHRFNCHLQQHQEEEQIRFKQEQPKNEERKIPVENTQDVEMCFESTPSDLFHEKIDEDGDT